MRHVEIDLELPDSVAEEAEEAGLLNPAGLERLLREEVRRLRVERLFQAADQLAALGAGPPTEAEIEAEIAAARAIRSRR
ncbi:MAG: hypothetical protein U0641_02655 [Anaerolineae bacterium]